MRLFAEELAGSSVLKVRTLSELAVLLHPRELESVQKTPATASRLHRALRISLCMSLCPRAMANSYQVLPDSLGMQLA